MRPDDFSADDSQNVVVWFFLQEGPLETKLGRRSFIEQLFVHVFTQENYDFDYHISSNNMNVLSMSRALFRQHIFYSEVLLKVAFIFYTMQHYHLCHKIMLHSLICKAVLILIPRTPESLFIPQRTTFSFSRYGSVHDGSTGPLKWRKLLPE